MILITDIRFYGEVEETHEDAAVAYKRGHKYFVSQYKGEFWTDNKHGKHGTKNVVWRWNGSNYKCTCSPVNILVVIMEIEYLQLK